MLGLICGLVAANLQERGVGLWWLLHESMDAPCFPTSLPLVAKEASTKRGEATGTNPRVEDGSMDSDDGWIRHRFAPGEVDPHPYELVRIHLVSRIFIVVPVQP